VRDPPRAIPEGRKARVRDLRVGLMRGWLSPGVAREWCEDQNPTGDGGGVGRPLLRSG